MQKGKLVKHGMSQPSKRLVSFGYPDECQIAFDRAGGQCEFEDGPEWAGGQRCEGAVESYHHVVPRRVARLDEAWNLMALCKCHHNWIHANEMDARNLGFLTP